MYTDGNNYRTLYSPFSEERPCTYPQTCPIVLFSTFAFLVSPTRRTDGDGCCQAARADQDRILAGFTPSVHWLYLVVDFDGKPLGWDHHPVPRLYRVLCSMPWAHSYSS